MSEENVEAFKRTIEAANRQDVEALGRKDPEGGVASSGVSSRGLGGKRPCIEGTRVSARYSKTTGGVCVIANI
jgi:hypothetical protein